MKKLKIVIFSKNRACQLDALLKTFLLYCVDSKDQEINVLYKATTIDHAYSYEKLISEYACLMGIKFIEENSFKTQTLKIIEDSQYILFLVDDCIITDFFNPEIIMRTLESNENLLIGFSMRLGKGINYCYTHNSFQKFPEKYFIDEVTKILIFDWRNENYDFGYPLEVSSSFYCSKMIYELIKNYSYDNPNQLEGILYMLLPLVSDKPYLACYENPVAFCNPLNLVNSSVLNRHGINLDWSSESLLKAFLEGKRIDIKMFDKINITSPHMEREIELI